MSSQLGMGGYVLYRQDHKFNPPSISYLGCDNSTTSLKINMSCSQLDKTLVRL